MKRPTHLPSRLAATTLAASLFATLFAAPALAQVPSPWAITMQAGFSPVKRDMIALNHLVLGIVIFITLLVGGLLAWVIWRYNAKRHPVPTTTSHNTVV